MGPEDSGSEPSVLASYCPRGPETPHQAAGPVSPLPILSSSSWQGSLLRPSLEPVCPRLRSDEASYTSSGFQENGLSGTCFDPAELTGPRTKQGLVLWRPSHPWPEAAGSGGWLDLEVRARRAQARGLACRFCRPVRAPKGRETTAWTGAAPHRLGDRKEGG